MTSEGFGSITDKKGNKYFYGAGKFAGQREGLRQVTKTMKDKEVKYPKDFIGPIKKFKKGGKVKKTGKALVHKGERVLTAKQNKKFESARKSHFGIKKNK
jgi:hypothetical protein